MHKIIITFITALSLVALPAHADRDFRRGGSYHHGGGGSAWAGVAVIGALTGLAILAERSRPVYVDPYYTDPGYPVTPVYVAPPVNSVPAPVASDTWYYCQSSAMYYPYARGCPEGWQAVPSRPY